MNVRERMRIGGRSARIQSEVHKAVKELQSGIDRDEITVPMIAARAGVPPSTIYRRWGDLSELLADVAVERLRPVADPDDTGTTNGDLKAFAEQYMEEFSSPAGRTLLRDLFSNNANAPHAGKSCSYTYEHIDLIAARAEARGEAPFDVYRFVDRVIAPIMYHILFGRRDVTHAYVHELLRDAGHWDFAQA
jgi:AcrR family transcriptional regulator